MSTPSRTAPSANRPRKSTLTQQQKNKKRQRASHAQLAVLHPAFRHNPTPSAKAREEIGRKIDMTERSVQIWFQNARAKAKKEVLYHRSYTDLSSMHDSMSSGRHSAGYGMASPPSLMDSPTDSCDTSPSQLFSVNSFADCHLSKSLSYIMFSCASLAIGKWQRVSSTFPNLGADSDLVVYYSPSELMFTYMLQSDTTNFKIEFPSKLVETVEVVPGEANLGHVTIRLASNPCFYTKAKTSDIWVHSGDFSAEEQASRCFVHRLCGPYNQLCEQMRRLYSFLPSKVSDVTLTLPQTVKNEEQAQSYDDALASLGSDMQWLAGPQRNATMSTPALPLSASSFDDSHALLNYGCSVSDCDVTTSSPVGPISPLDDLCMTSYNDNSAGYITHAGSAITSDLSRMLISVPRIIKPSSDYGLEADVTESKSDYPELKTLPMSEQLVPAFDDAALDAELEQSSQSEAINVNPAAKEDNRSYNYPLDAHVEPSVKPADLMSADFNLAYDVGFDEHFSLYDYESSSVF